MKLVRDILLELENIPYDGKYKPIRLADYKENEIDFHVALLSDAGLIVAHRGKTSGTPGGGSRLVPVRLTWEGCEFLDAARDDRRWEEAITTVSGKLGSLPFDVLKAVLIDFAQQAVGLR